MPHKEISGIENINPNRYGGTCSRAVALGAKQMDFEKGIETIATTEAPALVIDWERWQIIREILPMRYCEIPTNNKVPLLDSHMRHGVDKIKGSASDFRTEKEQLICKTFISKSETQIREKILEGHIDSVSIGYRVDAEFTVEIPKKATVLIDGIEYKNEYDDDYPLVVRTWWKSHELSLVPIGADEAAKFKSAHEFESKQLIERITELTNEIKSLRQESQKASFKKGDKVKVKKGMEHMSDHEDMTLTVDLISSEKAISVKMEDGTIHKWYIGSELEKVNEKSTKSRLEKRLQLIEYELKQYNLN